MIWGDKYTVQCTNDVLYNCIPENYIILLTNVTPINLIKNNKKIFKQCGASTCSFVKITLLTARNYTARLSLSRKKTLGLGWRHLGTTSCCILPHCFFITYEDVPETYNWDKKVLGFTCWRHLTDLQRQAERKGSSVATCRNTEASRPGCEFWLLLKGSVTFSKLLSLPVLYFPISMRIKEENPQTDKHNVRAPEKPAFHC